MSILQQLGEIRALPTLPRVVAEVQKLVAQDEADAGRLAKVVECDPPLAAAVLRLANSAFYGAIPHRISSIPLALTRIGFNEVRNVAIAMGFVRQFFGAFHVLDHMEFWRHCLTAAYCVDALGGREHGAEQRYFLAGLLHDIGILLYDQCFCGRFQEVAGKALREGMTFLQGERAYLKNETHAMVGAALLELWKLDAALVAAVRFHHEPRKCPQVHRRMAAAVHCTEYFLCSSRIGSFEGVMTDDSSDLFAEMSISLEAMASLASKAEEQALNGLHCAFPREFSAPLPRIERSCRK